MSLMTFVAVPFRILPSQASRAASLAIHSEYYQARRVEQLAWRYIQKASQHRQNISAEELAIHSEDSAINPTSDKRHNWPQTQ